MANVYTGGTFDLFHEGHLELLEACSRMAGSTGYVVVALNTDEFIERFKGKKPVQSFDERRKVLEACRYVNMVVPNIGEEDSKKTIEAVEGMNKFVTLVYTKMESPLKVGKIDIVAIGTDWANRDYYGQMGFTKEWLDDKNIVLVYVDRRTGQSTTHLKEIIKEH